MDQYSTIPDYVVKEQLEEPIELASKATTVLGTFAGMVLFKIILVLVIACCISCKKK